MTEVTCNKLVPCNESPQTDFYQHSNVLCSSHALVCLCSSSQHALAVPRLTVIGVWSFGLNMERSTQKKVEGLYKVMTIFFSLLTTK